MSAESEPLTSRVATKNFPSYDRAYVDMKTVVDIICSKAIESFQWINYVKSAEITQVLDFRNMFSKLSLEEGQHESVVISLTDTRETVLEKVVAGQISHIVRLAQFISGEPQEAVRHAYEYILLDHLNHHRQFTNKLARKEGLSPMARADFVSSGGRDFAKQLIGFKEALKTPYDMTTASPLTKVQIRLALAQELHICHKHIGDIEFCDDGHLISIYRQAALVDNLHVAMLQSLIDPRESELESMYLWELAEVASFEQALSGSSTSVEKPLAGILVEDRGHLDMLRSLPATSSDISLLEMSKPWPVISSAESVSEIVNRVSGPGGADHESEALSG
ncbi:MAG TPA: hypothetical protein ENI11_04935 [Actinobacteria bacterium]|nr:hypothetical protein [Actinomycetota bacterium]